MVAFSAMTVVASSLTSRLSLRLLAVGVNGTGEVINATIWVSVPGSGVFTVKPLGLVGEDTVLSARVALFYAALLAGRYPMGVDAGLYIESSEGVSGASAGLAFLAGYYALLRGSLINTTDTAFTGLISPNGIVAAVGGVPAKLGAAARAGLRIVYVPYEASAVNITGLQVRRVCSFAEVLSGLYGLRVAQPNVTRDRIFCQAADQIIKLLEESMSRFSGLLDNATWTRLNDSLSLARRLRNSGACYAAASVGYSALVSLTQLLPRDALAPFINETLALVNRDVLAERLYALKAEVMKAKRVPLWRLEALLASLYRFYAASKLLSEHDLRLRALGALRLLTAQQWAEAAEALRGPLVDAHVAREALRLLVAYGDLSYKYMESLVKGRQVKIENMEHIRLRRLVQDMNADYVKGALLESAALALEVIDTVSRAIAVFDMHMGAPPKELSLCAATETRLHEVASGYPSITARLLAEYAASVNDTVASALIYSDAAAYSVISLAVAAAASQPAVQPSGSVSSVNGVAAAAVGLAGIVAGVVLAALLAKKVE